VAVVEPSSGERVVVVSPHLDDAVLSVGASVARWAHAGASVEVLTVFAGDPESGSPAGGWDSRAGFRTEGEAARARREEDARACALLGAIAVWLDFGYQDYDRHGSDDDVRLAVSTRIGHADAVLFPGSPLSHPDHELLVRVVADAPIEARRLGLYLEQPYGLRSAAETTPPWLEVALGSTLQLEDAPAGPRDRLAKWRALRAYRSQLPLLALTGRRTLTLALHAERIVWLDGSSL
jgi:LmbE family N-acetylglucosaminyl deacetylase